MKKKVGTILDEELILMAKQIALSHGESLSQVLEKALKLYMLTIDKRQGERQKNISQKTRGTMKISPKILKGILEEENIYEIG